MTIASARQSQEPLQPVARMPQVNRLTTNSVDTATSQRAGQRGDDPATSPLTRAMLSARRNSCCVANFADVAVRTVTRPRPQTKLAMSAVGDVYEREADRIADRVSRMSDSDAVTSDAVTSDAASAVATSASSRDGGNMDQNTRASMQRRFGADFSDVRLHTDGRAASMSSALNARAFTVGRDIYFGRGQYAPSSDRGRHLLAHELTHTIQQRPAHMQRSVIAQGVEGAVQSPDELSRYEDEAASTVTPVAQMVQRSATWNGATVHENVNLAELLFGGNAPISMHMLNGTMLTAEADADSSIKKPAISTSGSASAWKAKVDSVPAQEGAADESVLSAGPWTKATTKGEAGTTTGLAACSGADPATFTAHGKPSDDAVFKANRRHEDHHVADHKVAFTDTIDAWDKKVQDAKDKGTEFAGTSDVDATAKLWAAMGNTPTAVAREFRTQGFTKGAAFHRTAAGGKMSASNPTANADCSTCGMDVTNPS